MKQIFSCKKIPVKNIQKKYARNSIYHEPKKNHGWADTFEGCSQNR